MSDLPEEFDAMNIINWNGKPLLCGGGHWRVYYRTACLVYENNRWVHLADLNLGRRLAAMAVLSEDKFIVMGGNSEHTIQFVLKKLRDQLWNILIFVSYFSVT